MSDELRQHVRMPILELLRHRQALDWWLPRPVSRQCNRRLGACLLGLERCGGGVVSQLPLCRRCARPRHPRRRKRLALRRPSGRVHVLACQHTRRAGDGRSAWALASSSDEESSSSFFKRRTAGGAAGCAGMPPSDVAELRFETARLQTASATARLVLGRLLGVTTHSVSASPTPSRAYGSGPTSKQCRWSRRPRRASAPCAGCSRSTSLAGRRCCAPSSRACCRFSSLSLHADDTVLSLDLSFLPIQAVRVELRHVDFVPLARVRLAADQDGA